jgi:hypothetical protein
LVQILNGKKQDGHQSIQKPDVLSGFRMAGNENVRHLNVSGIRLSGIQITTVHLNFF